MEKKYLGIYVHIPFCKSKCDYCDFYSLAGYEDRMDAYQAALITQIKETAPQAKDYQVDTIYFGGGTPSYYGAKRLVELLKVIKKQFKQQIYDKNINKLNKNGFKNTVNGMAGLKLSLKLVTTVC